LPPTVAMLRICVVAPDRMACESIGYRVRTSVWFATALFVAPFNGLARLVVTAWLCARLLWTVGLSEPLANVAEHMAILAIGYGRAKGVCSVGAWMMSAFIIVFSGMWASGKLAGEAGWWFVLIFAFAQLAFLGLSTDRETARRVLEIWKEEAGQKMMQALEYLKRRVHHG